ncbi:MAG: hypothetical protein QOJ96_1350 [Alphaproteobacteria bacterium]|jgi:hypothetical protein|nr:hypothetical protein [Alphaproteobacteria bacterium]
MNGFLTPDEGIALDVFFGLCGESRFISQDDAPGAAHKYHKVASGAPKLM